MRRIRVTCELLPCLGKVGNTQYGMIPIGNVYLMTGISFESFETIQHATTLKYRPDACLKTLTITCIGLFLHR